MVNWDKLTENLKKRGYAVSRFPTKEEAAAYLDSQIDGVSVAFGGSMTVQEMGLYPKLAAHNNAIWHWTRTALPWPPPRTCTSAPSTAWRRAAS